MPSVYNKSLNNRVYIVPQLANSGYVTSGSIGEYNPLILDATTDVSVNYSADVTSYFVNSGTDNSDHIRNQPKTISFSGVISNDLGIVDFIIQTARGNNVLNLGVATDGEGNVSTGGNPAALYHLELKDAMSRKTLFSVYVPNVGVLNNCVITNVSFSTDSHHYNAFIVSLELVEIRLPRNVVPVPVTGLEDVTKIEQAQATSGTVETPKTEIKKKPVIGGAVPSANITAPDQGGD